MTRWLAGCQKPIRNVLICIYLRGDNVMNRIPRTVGTFALAATLLTAAVPAAQARTLANPQAPSVSGSLFDVASAWLRDLGFSALFGVAHQAPTMKSTTIPLSPPPVPIMRPMGCSTIDPNGSTGINCHGGF
jgi:hypothetical protein